LRILFNKPINFLKQVKMKTYLKVLRNIFCLLAFTILCSATAFSQSRNGSLIGIVETSDKEPLSFASVLLRDTKYGVMAGEDGSFTIQAPAGTYTLIVTYTGYVTIEKSIEVVAGEKTDVGTITVNADSRRLKEVVISDIQTNKFAKKMTSTVARMPLADIENPSAYSIVTKDFMQEIVATDMNSAVVSVPGVITNNGVNDSGNDFTLRGFTSSATFRNGLAINPRTQTEISNVERIEILKGPAATLFGGLMSTYGGVVNTVTKRPFEIFRGEVNYTTGSWGLNRFTADINTPLNKDRTALARFNAAAFSQNSFQDAGYSKGLAFAASLAFKTSERTTVRFDADIYTPDKTLSAYVRNSQLLEYKSMKDLKSSHGRSFTSNDIGTKRTSYYALAEVEHRLSDNWLMRTSYQHGESGEKESIFLVLMYNKDNSKVSRYIRPFDVYEMRTDNFQHNFIGEFHLGKIRNRFVGGVDVLARRTFYQYGTFKDNNYSRVFVYYDDVILDDVTPWQPITRTEVNKLERESTTGIKNSDYSISAYASNVIDFTDWLIGMASVRVDRYKYENTVTNGVKGNDDYHQVQVSPKFGLVAKLWKDKVSLFGNYSNGFTNVAPSLDADGSTIRKWDPQESYQIEGGFKFDLFGGRLTSTISYYDIKVKNMVRTLPDGTSEQDGTQYSRGFEAEVIANPVRGLNIVAGFGANKNRYTRYNDAYQDKKMYFIPDNIFNLWASYKILDGKAEGLGLGAGTNYVSKSNLNMVNDFYVPAYTLLNASIFYDQPKYKVTLKVNNLTDVTYWSVYGQPQNPRQFLLNISYKF